jgi:hypothetical protein
MVQPVGEKKNIVTFLTEKISLWKGRRVQRQESKLIDKLRDLTESVKNDDSDVSSIRKLSRLVHNDHSKELVEGSRSELKIVMHIAEHTLKAVRSKSERALTGPLKKKEALHHLKVLQATVTDITTKRAHDRAILLLKSQETYNVKLFAETLRQNVSVPLDLPEMVDLIEKVFQGGELDEKSEALLKDFLAKAHGNTVINKILSSITHKTKAEEFLYSFSYAMPCSTELKEVDYALQEAELHKVLSYEKEALSLESEICKSVEGIAKSQEYVEGLTISPHLRSASQRYNDKRLLLLKKMLRDPEVKANPELERQVLELKKRCEYVVSKIAELERKAGQQGYQPPLSFDHARALARSAKILEEVPEKRVDALAALCPDLIREAKESVSAIEKLDALTRILPGCEPGDVVFDDEKLHKLYRKKEGGVVLSDRHVGVRKFLSTLIHEGPWAARTYFTGPLIHSSIIACLDGEPHSAEIVTKYYHEPYTLEYALTRKAFRPVFESKDVFAKSLTSMLEDEKSLDKIQFSAVRGVIAVILSNVGLKRPKSRVQHKTDNVFEKVHGGPEQHQESPAQILLGQSNQEIVKMICSEFVAKMVKAAGEDAGLKIIPASIPTQAISLSRLKNILLKSHMYKEVEQPLLCRALFQQVES